MEEQKKYIVFWGALALLGIVWVWTYYSHMNLLLRKWNTDDYSYCYLVPFLAGYLAWLVRKRVYELIDPFSTKAGYLGIILAFLLFLSGRLGSLETLVYVSMWVSIVSIVILLLGLKVLRVLWFPLFILAFSVPAPPFITQLLTFKLRLISSTVAVQFIHLLGIPAFQQGNIIDLGTTQLQVVDACSGLRYLIPTVIMALVIGYLLNKKLWQQLTLLFLSVPIAILVNSLRIVVMALLARYVSPVMAQEGMLHDFTGWLIFVISVSFLVVVNILLKRFFPARESGEREKTKPAEEAEKKTNSGLRRLWLKGWIHAVILIVMFLGFFILQDNMVQAQVVPERKSFVFFPENINGWTGERMYLDPEILEGLWADDYVSSRYYNPHTGNSLHLLVSYYATQTTHHTAHAPTSCLLGGGWSLENKEVLPPKSSSLRDFPVQQMVLYNRGQKILSNFWFQQRGRVITSEYANKFYLIWDSIAKQRTDGALVRVEMFIQDGQSVQEAQNVLDGFLVGLRTTLKPYLPN